MQMVAIIPARSGSKGIPGKNTINLLGHPLIAYTIEAALQSELINRVIVSTDSQEIADIAKKYGAEIPFLRPKKYASDNSPDIQFLMHALNWMDLNEGSTPEYLVHLRPTTPLRSPAVIDAAITAILKRPEATSLRSAHLATKTPYKWFELDRLGFLDGIMKHDLRPEYYNLPRQEFPNVYDPNGYVDIVKSEQIKGGASLHGNKMLGFITPFTHELDTTDDLIYMEYLVAKSKLQLSAQINDRLKKKAKKL